MATNVQNRALKEGPTPLLQLQPRPPRRPRGRVAAVLLVLGLLALIAPSFIHLNRFRQQLTATLSATLGRDVAVEKVWLHLLPRPGFTIRNFSIADAEGFGAEPMLRSQDVSASLRLSSLWRGRLEIASLSLKEPSLNLVRDQTGRWNIEALLERAAHTPSAPTAMARAEARPRFPYIQAENGRINFKFEQEKKVYTLINTDFAFWLASEDEWRMRLAGTPIRTDANLSNTGTLKAEGSFKRAADLRATPLKLEASLEGAQLGQLTHLSYGFDRGWRGGVKVAAVLNGTPGDFSLSTDARITDFRRYDIARNDSVTLQAHCDAHYRSALHSQSFRNFFLNLQCHSPVQDGQVVLHAELSPGESQPLLDVIALSVPLSSVASLVGHAKKGVPEDFTASGSFSGNFQGRSGEVGGSWVASGVRLRSDGLRPAVPIGNIILSVDQYPRPRVAAAPENDRRFLVRVLPFNIPIGGTAPLTAQATFSKTDFTLSLSGSADSQRLLAFFETLGLPLPNGVTAESSGPAKVDVQVSGLWAGFAAPTTAGIVRAQSASVARAGIKQE